MQKGINTPSSKASSVIEEHTFQWKNYMLDCFILEEIMIKPKVRFKFKNGRIRKTKNIIIYNTLLIL